MDSWNSVKEFRMDTGTALVKKFRMDIRNSVVSEQRCIWNSVG
ncbi:MAG: hypothetical protein ACO263_08385 [Cyclobacteriaceae bacterium]